MDGLSDEILQYILDLAMTRDSPFYINPLYYTDPDPKPQFPTWYFPPPVLESSTGAKDPLFSNSGTFDNTPVHQKTPQSNHLQDWILINSINRRIRRLGKESFFRIKVFAMKEDIPARLQKENLPKMIVGDQRLALSCIRHIVVVDPRTGSPMWYLDRLPKILAAFPNLRRCTLLFGFSWRETGPEWITAAMALRGPTSVLQELMVKLGSPEGIVLEEAMGPTSNWDAMRGHLQNIVYPMLRMKIERLQARQQRELGNPLPLVHDM